MAPGVKTGGANFKPGNKGGPGRPKIPEDIKLLRDKCNAQLTGVVAKFWTMTKEELSQVIKDPKSPYVEILVARCFERAAMSGDYARAEALLERIVGKVEQKIHHSGSQTLNVNAVAAAKESIKVISKDPQALEALELISEKVDAIESQSDQDPHGC